MGNRQMVWYWGEKIIRNWTNAEMDPLNTREIYDMLAGKYFYAPTMNQLINVLTHHPFFVQCGTELLRGPFTVNKTAVFTLWCINWIFASPSEPASAPKFTNKKR